MKKLGLTDYAIKSLEKILNEEKVKLTAIDELEKTNKKKLADNNTIVKNVN